MTPLWLQEALTGNTNLLFLFSSHPSVTPAHFPTLSIVFLSLFEFLGGEFCFFAELVPWKTKRKIALVSIISLPDDNDRLCARQTAVMLTMLS